jgi:hypothetical protein
VIGYDVENDPHAARGERRGHAVERGRISDLGIERVVIGHIVTVRAARPGLEAGRQIGIGHPEGLEIRRERGDVIESQRGPELEAIGGDARASELGDRLPEDRVGVHHRCWTVAHKCVNVSLG